MQNKKIPVYILTGFLGSGKTTLLRRLLEMCDNRGWNPGVILNELGEINVEKDLFEHKHMLELLNGCICCTIKDGLTRELSHFLKSTDGQQQKLDMLFIEGTGVANPLEIVEALTHPSLMDYVEIKSIISIVDASKYLNYQSRFASTKEIREILRAQILHSTIILLNKVDLLTETKLAKVRKKISQLTGQHIEIIDTSYANMDLDEVLKPRMSIMLP